MTTYIIESAVFMGVALLCYFVMFSNGKYFHFNRVFLLFTLMLSLLVPIMEIEINNSYAYFDDTHFNVGSQEDMAILGLEDQSKESSVYKVDISGLSPTIILAVIYVLGVLMMLYRYIINLIKIINLTSNSKWIDKGPYRIILVEDQIGPFSFMKNIFVNSLDYSNNKIDATVMSHELAHVKYHHTIDILFVELLLVVFFFNPLVWLYRYAVKLNHEYMADNEALKINPDIEKFANHLIYSKTKMLFECSFNYLSTKKRLMMLTKSKNNKLLFGNKVALATVAVVITSAILSFENVQKPDVSIKDKDKFTVVIDLGHGGKDLGASSLDGGVTELEIVNSIGSIIKEIETTSNFVYSRNTEFISLKERTDLAASKNADLFLSLHVNYNTDEKASGLEVYYSGSNIAVDKSQEISKLFVDQLEFRKGSNPNKIRKADFYVLKESNCPSILLNIGFLSNKKDLEYLMNKSNQQNLAQQIVDILEGLVE